MSFYSGHSSGYTDAKVTKDDDTDYDTDSNWSDDDSDDNEDDDEIDNKTDTNHGFVITVNKQSDSESCDSYSVPESPKKHFPDSDSTDSYDSASLSCFVLARQNNHDSNVTETEAKSPSRGVVEKHHADKIDSSSVDTVSKNTVSKRVSCTKCHKRFSSKSLLAIHAEVCKVKFVCPVCSHVLSSKTVLKHHMGIHDPSNRRVFLCPQCGKVYTKASTLKEHISIKHGGVTIPRFKCLYCEKTFVSNFHKNAHERSHTNERPFECPVCCLRFNHKCTMKRHLMRHTGERKYSCPICNKGFVQSTGFKHHMKTHSQDCKMLIETLNDRPESEMRLCNDSTLVPKREGY